MPKNQPAPDQIRDFQTLLASGNSPEAKALAEALNNQQGAAGVWGPKTKAAFAAACTTVGVLPESVDFTNPENPALKKIISSLTEPDGPSSFTTLSLLLDNKFGEIGNFDGNAFGARVIAAAEKYNIPLETIRELRHADLDGNGRITKEEIGTLIETAHESRAGQGFGRDANYSRTIRKEDTLAMLDRDVVTRAKETYCVALMQQERAEEPASKAPANDDTKLHKNAKFESFLKDCGFHATAALEYKDMGDQARATASNVRNALPVSKANGIG